MPYYQAKSICSNPSKQPLDKIVSLFQHLIFFVNLYSICSVALLSSQEQQAICTIFTSMTLKAACTGDCSSVCTQCSSYISCNTQNITKLNLYETQISGTIPTQIGQLTYLTYFNLDATQINGTIPTQIGLLTSLTFFDLAKTKISGTIPTQIGLLSFLTYFYLYSTQISGTIPTQVGLLKYLTYFDLDATQISGTIPTQIGLLSSLSYFDVGTTKISGTIPTQVGLLKSLTYFFLPSTQISGTIPTQIGELVSLTYLDFSYTEISGTIPTQLSQITNLQTLYLENTQLCGCPHLPPNLNKCELTGIHYLCNCSILPICRSSQCVTSLACPIIHSTPQPSPYSPIIHSTPQPSPYSPIIHSTPTQPNPYIGCKGNYGAMFTCNDGKWSSITDVTINGTNLTNSVFNFTTVFMNGDMLISESTITVESSLYIEKYTVLTLQNSSIFVSGNLSMNPQSTILLNTNNNFTVHIKHCVFLDGSLVITIDHSQTLKTLPILTSPCINGTFSSVFVTDNSQCDVIIPHLEHDEDTLSVAFDIVNHCSSKGQSWIYIVIGIAGVLLLIVTIRSAFVVRSTLAKRNKRIDSISQTLATAK